jgi:hypothetical protein
LASVIPVAKALYLCDNVMSDPTRTKPHLIGVLNSIRAPLFPHIVPRLGVFAQLIGGYGDVRCRIRIVNAHTHAEVYQSGEQTIRFDDRLQTKYFVMRLSQITVHGPSDYWVEFFCDDQFMDDAVLHILG